MPLNRRAALAAAVLPLCCAALAQAEWRQTHKLTAADARTLDQFGISVAIDGGTVLVGAHQFAPLGDAGTYAGFGSAYLFDAATGRQIHKLTAADAAIGAKFGRSVAIDGKTAVVGAPGVTSGSTYLFDAVTGRQTHKLTAPDAAARHDFGQSVAIDGSTTIVSTRGAAPYVFDATTGQQTHTLSGRVGSVAIDGRTAIGSTSGSAYLFDAATGRQTQTLTPADASRWFVPAVAISGRTAVVGDNSFGGAAYVFDTATGRQAHKLTPTDTARVGGFGQSVAISDGNVLAGGYIENMGRVYGSAYVFDAATGRQTHKLSPTDAAATDAAAYTGFGESVAISGRTAIVGAPGVNDDAGAVYVFERYIPAAKLPTDPTPLERIDPPTPPAPEPREKNLVFITHGWNGPTGSADHSWINDMADDIRRQVGDDGDWQVVAWNWEAESGGLLPNKALSNSLATGSKLGSAFDKRGYDKVHLIAHSAGSAMIEAIARGVNDGDTLVHTTFLDPYAPGTWANEYSMGADRAENYFTNDAALHEGGAIYKLSLGDGKTEPILRNAHNVDVTWLDGNRDEYDNSTHGYPWQFYKETTASSGERFDEHGYGFALSPFYDNWDDSRYPSGQSPTNPGRVMAFTVALSASMQDGGVTYQGPQIRNDQAVNFDQLVVTEFSETGTVEVAGTSLTLETGSPVWFAMLLDVGEAVNFVNFEAEFLSDAGAEGLLSVYWEGELIGTVDERFPLNELFDEYSMPLFEDFGPGEYTLAFRLDPFTDVASSVLIDNVATGLVAVPEPGALALVGAGGLTLLRRRKVG